MKREKNWKKEIYSIGRYYSFLGKIDFEVCYLATASCSNEQDCIYNSSVLMSENATRYVGTAYAG